MKDSLGGRTQSNFKWNLISDIMKMQLDIEVSPPAFVRAQLELECTCSVPGVYNVLYMQCRLNVGCIDFWSSQTDGIH